MNKEPASEMKIISDDEPYLNIDFFLMILIPGAMVLVSQYVLHLELNPLIMGLAIIFAIRSIRQQHADEVYVLLLIFFAMTYITLLLLVYVNSVYKLGDIFESGPNYVKLDPNSFTDDIFVKTVRTYIDISTDILNEFKFLGFVIGIVVIPQILSFIVGGMFGCGRPPAFVYGVTRFAILSVIKFFCVFAAIQATFVLFFFYTNSKFAIPANINEPLASLAMSFLFTSFYYNLQSIVAINPIGGFGKIKAYMTRFTFKSPR